MTMGLVQIQLHFHLYDQHVQLLGVHQFGYVPTRREIENYKKIAKKFKNLKNDIMASFKAL